MHIFVDKYKFFQDYKLSPAPKKYFNILNLVLQLGI